MVDDPLNPILNQLFINASEVTAYIKELTPSQIRGLQAARDGYEDARDEMIANQPEHGVNAGITDQEITDLTTCDARIARIDVFLPPLRKAVELLTETRYALDDQRQRILLNGAASVDRRARKTPDLLAKYQKLRAYRSAAAKKAVKTKQKKAKEAQTPQAPKEAQTPQAPQAPAGVKDAPIKPAAPASL